MMEQMRPLYEALNIFVLEFYLRLVKKKCGNDNVAAAADSSGAAISASTWRLWLNSYMSPDVTPCPASYFPLWRITLEFLPFHCTLFTLTWISYNSSNSRRQFFNYCRFELIEFELILYQSIALLMGYNFSFEVKVIWIDTWMGMN